MAPAKAKDPRSAFGRSQDALTLEERLAFAGKVIALELYTPKTLPLRSIEAIGDSLAECIAMLRARGRDPRQHEFRTLPRPY